MASSSLVDNSSTLNADKINIVAGNQNTTNYHFLGPPERGNQPLLSPQSVNDVPVDFLSVHFTGRRNELDFLKESFNRARSDVPSRCAVHGMPGIGKTQLMLQYAKVAFDQNLYSHIFWISSTSVDKLTQGIANILDLVGHPGRTLREQSAKLTAARLWLEKSHEHGCTSWLLIFDNVDRSTLGFLRTHLPRRYPRGNILFTTRTADVAQALVNAAGERHRTLELRALELQDTTNLLLKDAGIDAGSATPCLLSRAEELVKCVGRLPLAVAQAGSFMKQTHTTLDDMLVLYKTEHKIKVIQWENDLTPYEERSVATTFTNQFDLLNQESRDVSNLLKLFSFLDPEGIPLDIIVNGAKAWIKNHPNHEPSHSISPKVREWFQKRVRGLGRQSNTTNNESRMSSEFHSLITLILSPTNFRTAIQKLQNLSLVEHQSSMENSTLRMHDLIQLMMQVSARKEESYGEWLQSSVSFVCGAFRQIERPELPQWWVECEKFTPHLRALSERRESVHATNLELTRALTGIARYLRSRGRYGEAEMLYGGALADLDKQLGTDHKYTLKAMNNLAWVYVLQRRYSEAEVLYRKALSGTEKQFGDDHVHTLTILDNLGSVCHSQSRFHEAEWLHRRALRGCERQLGANHTKTLTTMNNLALVLKSRRRYAESEALYERVLSESEKQLGADHPDTLTTVGNLGKVYWLQGRYDEAEESYKRALSGQEKQLGVDHPDSLRTAAELAKFYRSRGR